MNKNDNKNMPAHTRGEILVYQTGDGHVKLDVRLEDETVWLTQQMMAELFQTTKQNIGQHLKNIFEEGELDQNSVVKKFFTTEFLRFNDRRVLPNAGKVSKQVAEDHARAEYEKFKVRRREYKESIGEKDYIKQLEEAARFLPETKKF
jgi:hypothetical protein